VFAELYVTSQKQKVTGLRMSRNVYSYLQVSELGTPAGNSLELLARYKDEFARTDELLSSPGPPYGNCIYGTGTRLT